MPDFSRRTYLGAAVGGIASIGGLMTVTEVAGQSSGDGPPGQGQGNSSQGNGEGKGGSSAGKNKGGANQCTPPNVLLAKFVWETDEFVFEKGEDEDAIRITDVQYKDEEQEPIGFDWESDRPVCNVRVKAGNEIHEFTGGTNEGSLDVSTPDGVTKAISNVIFCVRPAQAIVCEADMNMSYDAFNRLPLDPGSDGRTGVVQTTTDGATSDYVHGIIDVRTRYGYVELGELQTLSFDYFAGQNTGGGPDEVFIVVGSENNDGTLETVSTAFKHLGDGPTGQWQTLDVAQELTSSGTGEWRGIDITGDSSSTSDAIRATAVSLRDSGSTFSNALSQYGSDAVLLAVGFGAGNTLNPVTGDRYYDSLEISSPIGAETFDWPALVRLDVTVTSQSPTKLTVELETQQPEQGFDFADVSERSVKLNEFRTIAPPAEDGVSASEVEVVSDDTLKVTFDDPPSGDVVISGDLDTDRVLSFFGTTSL